MKEDRLYVRVRRCSGSGLIGVRRQGSRQGSHHQGHAHLRQVRPQGSRKCQTVLVVKDGDMKGEYMVAAGGKAPAHGDICKGAKEGVSLTGTVTEKDGKKTIT